MPGSILQAIFPVIAYLCIGYIAKRTKKFDPNNSGILIGYVLNISIPCMIVLDMTRQNMFADINNYIDFSDATFLYRLSFLRYPTPTQELSNVKIC